MRKYEEPVMEIWKINVEEIITTSNTELDILDKDVNNGDEFGDYLN